MENAAVDGSLRKINNPSRLPPQHSCRFGLGEVNTCRFQRSIERFILGALSLSLTSGFAPHSVFAVQLGDILIDLKASQFRQVAPGRGSEQNPVV